MFFFPTVTVISRSVHPKTSTARDRSGHWTTSARWQNATKNARFKMSEYGSDRISVAGDNLKFHTFPIYFPRVSMGFPHLCVSFP